MQRPTRSSLSTRNRQHCETYGDKRCQERNGSKRRLHINLVDGTEPIRNEGHPERQNQASLAHHLSHTGALPGVEAPATGELLLV